MHITIFVKIVCFMLIEFLNLQLLFSKKCLHSIRVIMTRQDDVILNVFFSFFKWYSFLQIFWESSWRMRPLRENNKSSRLV